MLSISDIAKFVSDKVAGIIPGAVAYGIAKSALRDDKQMPYADEKYIGIDDSKPAQVYSKQLTISSTQVQGRSYGDSEPLQQNTYGLAVIIYYDEKKSGLLPDQLYTFIQATITGGLKSEGYRSVRINVTNAILNDGAVWQQEYGATPLKLFGTQRLIQVNYNVVMTFDKNCITIPNCKI